MRYHHLVLLLVSIFLCFTNHAAGGPVPVWHGEILEVFAAENEVRVLVDGHMDIIRLDPDVVVYRRGRLVSVESMRPITEERFQEGLFFFNCQGKVDFIIVDYTIEEVCTPSGTLLIYYDIYGQMKDVEKFPFFVEGSAGF